MRQKRRYLADRARASLAVVERKIAFGRRVILENSRDLEAALERLPDLRPQSVSAGDAELMGAFYFLMRRIDEVAAQLADVLEQRAAFIAHVAPKIRRRKSRPNHHGAS